VYHWLVRIVVALGGNALLRRGEPLTAENQRANVRVAARALAPLARAHELVVSHGNGPQVGLLALQAESYRGVAPYPLDVLGAETEGMIGYLLEQELRNVLPGRDIATVLTMVEVDPKDPAFEKPTKPIGPVYDASEAERLQKEHGWILAPDRPRGTRYQRVVPSPLPRRVLAARAIHRLVESGFLVICAGGGGIPTAMSEEGRLTGVEAVIDKDRASALLAEQLSADMLVLATDVPGVYEHWGEPNAALLTRLLPGDIRRLGLDAGGMGPKVSASVGFASKPGRQAAIGSLSDLEKIVEGRAGTRVEGIE
jgi:carbamate kinase